MLRFWSLHWIKLAFVLALLPATPDMAAKASDTEYEGPLSPSQPARLDSATAASSDAFVDENTEELSPSTVQAQRDVLIALNRIGDVQLLRGDLDSALSAYERSLEIAEQLAVMYLGSVQAQRDVFVSLQKLGDAHKRQGDLDSALAAYKRALRVAEHIAAGAPFDAVAPALPPAPLPGLLIPSPE